MPSLRSMIQHISSPWRHPPFNSLQVSLTAGVVTVMTVGLGTAALWTSWKMEHILVKIHKQNVQYITHRFPKDVLHYSGEDVAIAGVQPAINSLSTENVWLWLENEKGEVIAQSSALSNRTDRLRQRLNTLLPAPFIPQVRTVAGRSVVLCSSPLVVKGSALGDLFVAQDITSDQRILIELGRSLAIAFLLSILGIAIAVSIYIRRSLMPLHRMSQLAGKITPDTLTSARLELKIAPQEVRDLAQACDAMLLHLSQVWEQQRQLVGDISHELRTPLTIIQGYLDSLLRRSENLTSAQQEALLITASEAKRTTQLLQDLIDLARAESGRIYFHDMPFLLNDLVTEVAAMSQQVSQRQIKIRSASDLIEVTTDRDRLKQILINLIDNALKYSPNTEAVTIDVSCHGASVMIEVSDRGEGIALHHQSRIFERFYRVDEAHTHSKGTGLGLAIVKTLIEQMGGQITLRSQLYQGSTFIITLPCDRHAVGCISQ